MSKNHILSIGTSTDGGGGFVAGYIDELRISKGIARWTANFTPPSAEYSEDAPAPGAGRRIFLIT